MEEERGRESERGKGNEWGGRRALGRRKKSVEGGGKENVGEGGVGGKYEGR